MIVVIRVCARETLHTRREREKVTSAGLGDGDKTGIA